MYNLTNSSQFNTTTYIVQITNINMTLNDSLENGVDSLRFKDVEFTQIRYTDILGTFF